MRTAPVAVIVMVTAMTGACVWALGRNADVGMAWVLLPALALSGALLPAMRGMWRRVTGISSVWAAVLFQMLTLTPVFASLFYIGNMAFASDEVSEKAVVERVYSEERHRQRRVGRGRYDDGEAYRVYRAQVVLRGSWRTTVPLSVSDYVAYRRGDTVMMRVARGAFGIDALRGIDHSAPSRRPTKPSNGRGRRRR